MKKLIFKKQGFTLSEVLTALTIIGVIAALTVPALIQKTQKQEYVSALQKTYSTLSQATNQIIAEHGSPKADENGESWLSDRASLYNMYKKYLNNAKECAAGMGCFEHTYKFLSGSKYESWNGRTDLRKLILNDGVHIAFEFAANTCDKDNPWSSGSKNVCANMFTDINGAKGPNILGRDVFEFVLKENGLYPAGCDDESYCKTKNNMGNACTCRVLTEDAMNY